MAGAITALSKLGIGTGDPVDTALAFMDFAPGVTRELIDTNGTRGTFFPDKNRILENRKIVGPRLSGEPTATELAYLLEWVMGGSPTGSTTKTYPWSNTPATRNLHFKPNAGEEWFLGSVGVDQCAFRTSSGQALSLDMGLVGRTYDATRSDFPSLTYDITSQPFICSHLVLSVAGSNRACRDFAFTVSGGIDRDRFLNSMNLTAVQRTSGRYVIGLSVPSGDNGSQFWTAGVAGCAVAATFTNPTTSSEFVISVANVMLQPASPEFQAGLEGYIALEGQCANNGTSNPVTITLKV